MRIPISITEIALIIVLILLAPLAIAGLALINTGLGRSRSAAHSMLASLCIFAVAAGAYLICGFAWQGYIGAPAHVIVVAGRQWNWLARAPFFFRGMDFNASALSLAACLQIFSVGLAALIPLGACLDRWKLSAACASTALLAGCTYPLFAHWVWGGGWLAQLGINAAMGRGVIDAGGSGTIQAVGGLTALALAWILGPRRGKYSLEGMPTAIPGHNAVLILFGCFLALFGWLGLNSAGAMLFTGAAPVRVVLISMNTALAAGAALLAAVLITGLRFGRPDVSISANGWVGGLVASSASCAFVSPVAALVIGGIAGALVTYSVEWFELHFGVDDPGGAISVHAVAGIWGLLAVGIFARVPASVMNVAGDLPGASAARDSGQWLAQLVAVATLIGFILPLTYGLNFALNRIWPQRVPMEGERQGLDLYELGAGAYPEFVTHSEEFGQFR
ncbi:MAG: ammonium transporter [Acidobacteria bacterium]|nr:MAG: ammonium transporter [Acidobacteriota bacterium]